MKLSKVKQYLSAKDTVLFDVMPNPSDLSEWIIWIREQSGKSHLLLNENESVVRTKDVNEILSLLKDIGVKSVQVSL